MPENNPSQTEKIWNNEVVGEFYSGMGMPITKEEIYRLCRDQDRSFSRKIDGRARSTYLGVDWGGKADMKGELKKLLDEEIIPRIQASPFQVEVAGHSDSDAMPKKWQKFYKSNWELSAARGATCVRYMIEKGVPAPRLLAAGYGDWYPRGIDSIKSINPMYNPLTLTWGDKGIPTDAKGNVLPTVLSLNKTKKQKSGNRRIQITFINPPHHGKGRSGTDYKEAEN